MIKTSWQNWRKDRYLNAKNIEKSKGEEDDRRDAEAKGTSWAVFVLKSRPPNGLFSLTLQADCVQSVQKQKVADCFHPPSVKILL